jgi:hypothetical protein
MATAAITGTVGDGATEAEIVTGGGTVIITLTGDTFIGGGIETAGYTEGGATTGDQWSAYRYYTQIVVVTGGTLIDYNIDTDTGTGNMKCALYADDAGTPGDLIANSGTADTAIVVNGVTVLTPLGSANVPPGTYHIACQTSINVQYNCQTSTGTMDIEYTTNAYADAWASNVNSEGNAATTIRTMRYIRIQN